MVIHCNHFIVPFNLTFFWFLVLYSLIFNRYLHQYKEELNTHVVYGFDNKFFYHLPLLLHIGLQLKQVLLQKVQMFLIAQKKMKYMKQLTNHLIL